MIQRTTKATPQASPFLNALIAYAPDRPRPIITTTPFLPISSQSTTVRITGSEQEFVGASPFVGFLSMGLFVSHGLRDSRAMFAGLFTDSWSLSGAAGIARPAPASGWAGFRNWLERHAGF